MEKDSFVMENQIAYVGILSAFIIESGSDSSR